MSNYVLINKARFIEPHNLKLDNLNTKQIKTLTSSLQDSKVITKFDYIFNKDLNNPDNVGTCRKNEIPQLNEHQIKKIKDFNDLIAKYIQKHGTEDGKIYIHDLYNSILLDEQDSNLMKATLPLNYKVQAGFTKSVKEFCKVYSDFINYELNATTGNKKIINEKSETPLCKA